MQMCPFCDKVYDESEYSHCPYCSGELDDDDEEVRPCPECGGCLHWNGEVWECLNCDYSRGRLKNSSPYRFSSGEEPFYFYGYYPSISIFSPDLNSTVKWSFQTMICLNKCKSPWCRSGTFVLS